MRVRWRERQTQRYCKTLKQRNTDNRARQIRKERESDRKKDRQAEKERENETKKDRD